jgi:sugar/nucleoside kinase (ribokinase family)
MAGADLIQLNEKEYNTIIKKSRFPEDFFLAACFKTKKIINLTKGSNGSETYIIDEQNLSKIKTTAYTGIDVVDPTGCGDVFLAAFGMNYVNSKNVKHSAKRANVIAALGGAFKGVADPDLLKQMIEVHMKEDE